MNLVYAEIAEIFVENGMRMGKVCVSGALKKVPLDLLTEAECGDTVLLCGGVAISRVDPDEIVEKNNVPGDSRKTD